MSAETTFEENKLRNFIASSRLEDVIPPEPEERTNVSRWEAATQGTSIRKAQAKFFEHIDEVLIGLSAVASADQLAGVHTGIRLTLGVIEDCGMQLLEENGESINPKHHEFDFCLVNYWDKHIGTINS